MISVPDPKWSPPKISVPDVSWVPPMVKVDDPSWVRPRLPVPDPNWSRPLIEVDNPEWEEGAEGTPKTIWVPDDKAVQPDVLVPDDNAVHPKISVPDETAERPMVKIDDPSAVHPTIEIPNPNCTLPPENELVSVTEKEHADIMEAIATSYVVLSSDDNGRPITIPGPGQTLEQVMSGAFLQRDRLIAIAAARIAPLQDAVDLEEATATEVGLLKKWKQYRMAVNRVPDQEGFPTQITWPSEPQ